MYFSPGELLEQWIADAKESLPGLLTWKKGDDLNGGIHKKVIDALIEEQESIVRDGEAAIGSNDLREMKRCAVEKVMNKIKDLEECDDDHPEHNSIQEELHWLRGTLEMWEADEVMDDMLRGE